MHTPQTDHVPHKPAFERSFPAFNTHCVVRVYSESAVDDVLDAVQAACAHYEQLFSHTLPTSSLVRINQAQGRAVEVEPALADLLQAALRYCEETQGLFDITMGPVVALWQAARTSAQHRPARIPRPEEIRAACAHVDYRRVHVEGCTVQLDDPQASLVLGGIAKGFIADALVDLLKQQGVEYGFVNLGGNVKVFGGKPCQEDGETPQPTQSHFHTKPLEQPPSRTQPFIVGLRTPKRGTTDPQDIFDTVALHDGAVVTSGIYERGLQTADGSFYHHILDPRTGMPADTDLVSASLISSTGLDADGYTTALIIMGFDRARDFIAQRPHCRAVFVTRTGQIFKTG